MATTEDSDLVRFIFTFATEVALLATHVADHTGHCQGCSWHEAARPVAPCDLHRAALRVAALRAAGQTPSPCSPTP